MEKASLPSDCVILELPNLKFLGEPSTSIFNSLARAPEITFREDPVSGNAEILAPLTNPGKPHFIFEYFLSMLRERLEGILRRLAARGSVLSNDCSRPIKFFCSLSSTSMHLASTMTSPANIPRTSSTSWSCEIGRVSGIPSIESSGQCLCQRTPSRRGFILLSKDCKGEEDGVLCIFVVFGSLREQPARYNGDVIES